MVRPQDVVGRFDAARAVVRYADGTEEVAEGPGGGLARAMEADGAELLAGLLHRRPDVASVELADGQVRLSLRREGGSARLELTWNGGPAYVEPILPAPHPALVRDPAAPLAVPDPASRLSDPVAAIHDPDRELWAVRTAEGGVAWYGRARWGEGPDALPVLARLGAVEPLGSTAFCRAFGVRRPVVAGAMAGAIASVELVAAMVEGGMLAFYGAGGVEREAVARDLDRLRERLGERPFGVNLLHNPQQPAEEEAVVDLYLDRGCRLASASAYMRLTPALVRYRLHGLGADEAGRPVPAQRVFAKVSRPEVAEQFLRPAPPDLVAELVRRGVIDEAQAALAARLPMADAITCEADSGGHTDHRPLPVLLPIVRRLRDRLSASGEAPGAAGVFVGAAGGLGSPESLRAAFALGADYVLTGSINQCTPEAGTSDLVRELLAQAGMADVASGIAPDMFELGAEVQVLRRGTMWPQRSRLLHETWKAHASWEEVPAPLRSRIERQVLRRSFDEVWRDCVAFWTGRDPAQLQRAERDPRHKMALVFRWYLGMSSRWARAGQADRRMDFQVWCGPAMGAFNDWVRGTSLEPVGARGVVRINAALYRAAQALERVARLEAAGVPLPPGAGQVGPDDVLVAGAGAEGA